jgi:Tol biopolymer transport system component
MVLDHRQYSKALAIVDIGANTTRERLNVGDEYLSGPELSPKGKYVTAWRRSCRRCPSDLVAYDVASSDEGVVLRAANEDVSIGRPTWSADESRVYFSVDSSEMLSHIVAVTVPGAESAILLGQAQAAGAEPEDDLEDAQEDEPEPEDGAGTEDGAAPPAEPPSNEPAPSEYTYPEVSPDGRFLAVVESSLEDGRWLGVMELETKAYTRIFEGRAQWPRWSPDSSRIAFETWNTEDDADPMRRDVEVAVVPRTGGSATVLTLNDLDDSAMGWSRDSKRIYFHQGSRDPDGDAWTNRVYWVEP